MFPLWQPLLQTLLNALSNLFVITTQWEKILVLGILYRWGTRSHRENMSGSLELASRSLSKVCALHSVLRGLPVSCSRPGGKGSLLWKASKGIPRLGGTIATETLSSRVSPVAISLLDTRIRWKTSKRPFPSSEQRNRMHEALVPSSSSILPAGAPALQLSPERCWWQWGPYLKSFPWPRANTPFTWA